MSAGAAKTPPKQWAPSFYNTRVGSTREEEEEEEKMERETRRGRPSFGEGSRFFANLAKGWRARREGEGSGTLWHAAQAYGKSSASNAQASASSSRLLVVRKASRPFEVEILGALSPEDSLRDFMRTQTVYDVLPITSRLVLMETGIFLRRAFVAFVENGVRCAPVWDAVERKFVSMLTLTDFLRMFAHAHAKGLAKPDQKSIAWWIKIEREEAMEAPRGLQIVHTTDSLYTAAESLVRAGVHRAPVREAATGETVSTLSLKDILKALYKHIRSMPLPVFVRAPLSAVGGRIGSWGHVGTCKPTDDLASAVHTILHRKVSSVAVVDEAGRLVDALTKADVVRLLADEVQTALRSRVPPGAELFQSLLQFSVADAIELRSETRPRPAVLGSDSLLGAAGQLVGHREQRTLYVLDDDERPVGAISTSDVVCFVLGLETEAEAAAAPTPTAEVVAGERLVEGILALDVRPEASSALPTIVETAPAMVPLQGTSSAAALMETTSALMDTSSAGSIHVPTPLSASALTVLMEE